jgi:hypothetical protein
MKNKTSNYPLAGYLISFYGLMFMIVCLPLYHFDNIMNLLSLEHLINEPRVLVWFFLEWIGLCVIALGLAIAGLIPWK